MRDVHTAEAHDLGAEIRLLSEIVPTLAHSSVVDLRAGRGDLGRALLVAGAREIHLLEDDPRNIELLEARFGGEPRVSVHGTTNVDSLLAGGLISPPVGILKLGLDPGVLGPPASLDPDVVVIAHRPDVELRGYGHVVAVVRLGEATFLDWDGATVVPGGSANLVFVHDRVLADVLPAVLRTASTLARATAELAEQRLRALDTVSRAYDRKADAIDTLSRERDVQAQAAAERLQMLERLGARKRRLRR